MRLFSFLFIFLAINLAAQGQRFIYDYDYIPDSTKLAEIQSEEMYLDRLANKSLFYSNVAFKNDSLMKANLEKQLQMTGALQINMDQKKGIARFKVQKDDLKNQIFLLTKVGTNNYKVLDQREMRWKIDAERQKIGVWETQRATLEMYGRIWTAWFTTEIPFPDGPYKFHGLPGLIVQISDENENHLFKLKEISKLDDFSKDKNVFESKFIDISQEQYQKIYLQYRKDPVGADIQTMPPGNMVVRNLDGSVVDMNKFRLDRENRLKENVRKNNNPLEFDLLQ